MADIKEAQGQADEKAEPQRQEAQKEEEKVPGPAAGGLLGLNHDIFRSLWEVLDTPSQQALRLSCKALRDAARPLMCSLTLEQRRGHVQRLAKFVNVGCLRDLLFSCGGSSALDFLGAVRASSAAQAVFHSLQRLELLEVNKDMQGVSQELATLSPGLQALSMCDMRGPLCAQDLSALSGLKSLQLQGGGLKQQGTLASLSALTTLTHLSLEGMRSYAAGAKGQGMSPIAHLRGLRTLELSSLELSSLQEMAQGCTDLAQLKLEYCTFPATHLPLFQRLQSLKLGSCDADPQQQVQGCAQLAGLTHLYFWPSFGDPDERPFLDVTPLSALTNLRELELGLTDRNAKGQGLESVLSSCTCLTRLMLRLGDDWAFDGQPLQGLRSLQSLDLVCSVAGRQLQSTLSGLRPLTTLTHLSLRTDNCGGAGTSIDVSSLSDLFRLKHLKLDIRDQWACGLAALGPACPQLAHVHIECKGLATAVAASAAAAVPAGQGCATTTTTSEGSTASARPDSQASGSENSSHDDSGGSGSSSGGRKEDSSGAGGVPGVSTSWGSSAARGQRVWASLREFELYLQPSNEPGAVAALQLHLAPNLTSLKGLSKLTLERGGPESSPEALRAACESLAACYSRGMKPTADLTLCRSAHNGPLAAYLSALQPLGPYVKEMYLRNPEEPTQGEKEALAAALPHLLPDHRPFWKPEEQYEASYWGV